MQDTFRVGKTKGDDTRPRAVQLNRAETDPDLISAREIFRALWRNLPILILAMAGCVALAWYYVNYVATPIYRAQAMILIETRQAQFVDLQASTPDIVLDQSTLNSEVAILRSRSLLGDVVDRLDLANDPEFNAFLERDASELTPDQIAAMEARGYELAIILLRSSVEVRNVPLTYILEITVSTGDPAKSASIANTIAQSYMDRQIELKSNSTKEGIAWLSERVSSMQQELREKERQLEEMRFQTGGDRLENRIVLDRLNNEAEATRELYQYFLSRLKEVAVQDGLHEADSQILSQAIIPFGRSWPKDFQIMAISTVVGLFLGLLAVFWRENLNRGVRRAPEIEAVTGYPVVGEVPRVPFFNRDRAMHGLVKPRDRLHAEAINDIKMLLQLSEAKNGPNVIAITSAVPGEGKTSLALAMLQNHGVEHGPMLLIDGDFRKSTLTRTLGKRRHRAGLSDVARDVISLDEAVESVVSLSGEFLPAGMQVKNPADFFSSPGFVDFIADARTRYGTLIIDTPPLLAVTDALGISAVADTCLFVTEWNRTPTPQITQAIGLLERVGANPYGIVLNKVGRRSISRRGYGSYFNAWAR